VTGRFEAGERGGVLPVPRLDGTAAGGGTPGVAGPVAERLPRDNQAVHDDRRYSEAARC
jgi:hypothetical protein